VKLEKCALCGDAPEPDSIRTGDVWCENTACPMQGCVSADGWNRLQRAIRKAAHAGRVLESIVRASFKAGQEWAECYVSWFSPSADKTEVHVGKAIAAARRLFAASRSARQSREARGPALLPFVQPLQRVRGGPDQGGLHGQAQLG